MRTGWKATHIAIAGFVIPYMAVYSPALMLQPGPSGSIEPIAVIYVVVKALVAVGLWGGAAIGFLLGPLNVLERIVAFAAAALLVAALPVTDELGFAACGAFVLWHWLRVRRARVRAA
jgi:TRAP-type uncharacterized transport system fused permease subunit